jgi:hypothetical protein
LTDVRPEIAQVVALEGRTAGVYEKAVEQFKLGAMTAEALALVIDRTIMPDVQAARARLKALGRVPKEHQPLVANAEEYLRLRDDSWRLRARALRKANMLTLRDADRAEHASLDAFQKIAPAEHQ